MALKLTRNVSRGQLTTLHADNAALIPESLALPPAALTLSTRQPQATSPLAPFNDVARVDHLYASPTGSSAVAENTARVLNTPFVRLSLMQISGVSLVQVIRIAHKHLISETSKVEGSYVRYVSPPLSRICPLDTSRIHRRLSVTMGGWIFD